MLAFGLVQLAAGIFLLLQPVLPSPLSIFITAPLALRGAFNPRRRLLCAAWLGFALAWLAADARIADRLDPALDGEIVEITGKVTGQVEVEARRSRLVFTIESGTHAGRRVRLPSTVRLNVYEPMDIHAGERWRLRVKLRRPRGFGNPGGFDYERWLFANGIGATGYVRDVPLARRLEPASFSLRAAAARAVAASVDGRAAGLVRGLATGDRSGISDADWDILRATGTAHLMAISGLHIGLVAGLVLALAAFLQRRGLGRQWHGWPAVAAFLFVLAYGYLAGFGLPVQRALAGVAIVLGARAWRRKVAPGHALGLALVIVLVLDPLAPLDAGFWLSFGAVAAILYTISGRRPRSGNLLALLRVQVALFLLLGPVTALIFGAMPLVSPLANLVAVPLFGVLVVPLVLVGLLCLLLPSPWAAERMLGAAEWLLDLMMQGLDRLARLAPPAVLPEPGVAAFFLGLLAVALLLAPRALPGRVVVPWLLLPVMAGLVVPAGGDVPLRLHFLDVGQGLAVVVETPTRTLVYDTGPRFGESNAADMVLLPFLEARGRKPDRVVISHGDSDHAGGLKSLRTRYPASDFTGRIRLPQVLEDCAGKHWQWDGVDFRLFAAGAGTDNNGSCLLHVRYRDFAVLLTGDIEASAESRLLREQRETLAADVVLIPHHGSRTSSTPAFVRAIDPAIAVAAAGWGNQWDFPKPAIVARWQEQGALVMTTGAAGAVRIDVDTGMFCVYRFRDRRALWREAAQGAAGGCLRFEGSGK